ncbi:MAG TPA: aspartyl/asparaginyl beta-hydroxylase domain-containing protein [Polyangia bacterium]
MHSRPEPETTLVGSLYHPMSAYPSLDIVCRRWQEIRDEVIPALADASFTTIDDGRVAREMWSILPLLPEPEDVSIFGGWERSREVVPKLWAFLQSQPSLKGYTISFLRAGGYIAPHRHANAFVTALLTLQAGEGCYMVTDGEQHSFRPGEIVVFDYRRLHLARNFSDVDWIALLMLLEPAHL